MFDQVALGEDGSGPEADFGDIQLDRAAVDDAVLVDVPEVVEVVDGLRRGPSVVRLQTLQQCDGVFVQEGQDAMGLEPPWVAGDREGDLPGNAWLPEFLDRIRAACQKPGRLVKGGAGVMDNVPDHESQLIAPLLVLLGTNAQDVASGLVIELSDNTKRLRLKKKLALKVE